MIWQTTARACLEQAFLQWPPCWRIGARPALGTFAQPATAWSHGASTRRVAAPSITPCRWCSKDGVASVPTVHDVPKKLRGLTEKIVAALRPFDVDLGPYKRPLHGYREHTAMVRLLWAEQSVPEKIAALPRKSKKKAEKAYRHLMQSNVSEYKTFVSNHNKFLKRHPEGASQAERRRPLQHRSSGCGMCFMARLVLQQQPL